MLLSIYISSSMKLLFEVMDVSFVGKILFASLTIGVGLILLFSALTYKHDGKAVLIGRRDSGFTIEIVKSSQKETRNAKIGWFFLGLLLIGFGILILCK